MISLVIPTYNRPHFMARLLEYYRSVSFAQPIVVVDSSLPSEGEANRSYVASLQGQLDIRYEMVPPSTNLYLKIAQALDMVDSKYAVLCADDDFVVPRAMEQCVRFLEANPDYSVAHGRGAAFVFQSHPSRDAYHGLYTYGGRRYTNDCNEPQHRLQNHLMGYAPTFYSVHRRSDLIRNMRLAYDNTVDYRFGELLPSCLSLIQGKAGCLDILYSIRQKDIPESPSPEAVSWPALLTSDDFSQRYAQFRNCLAGELTSVTGMSIEDAGNAVNHAFQAYLARALSAYNVGQNTWDPELPSVRTDVLKQAMRRAWRVIQVLPAAAHSAFLQQQLIAMVRSPREAYRQLRRERELLLTQDDMLIDKLLDPGSLFHADFLPIYEHVIHYPRGVMPSLRNEAGKISNAAC